MLGEVLSLYMLSIFSNFACSNLSDSNNISRNSSFCSAENSSNSLLSSGIFPVTHLAANSLDLTARVVSKLGLYGGIPGAESHVSQSIEEMAGLEEK